MLQVPGTVFPNNGWRKESISQTDIKPSEFGSLPGTPLSWTAFIYGDDTIRMKIEIDSNQKILCKLSHDDAGNKIFVEEVLFQESGTGNFLSGISEKQFPLRSVLCLGTGSFYRGAVYRSSGEFDISKIDNPHTVVSEDHEIAVHDTEMAISLGAALVLSSFMKFKKLDTSDGRIVGGKINPNIANIGQLIGFDKYVSVISGSTSNSFVSPNNPNYIVDLPSMYLSLPQFNGINGRNYFGDNTRDIAAIPGKSFTIDSSSVYNYNPASMLYTSLGLNQDLTLYELKAELRHKTGLLATNIENPVSITLHVRENNGNEFFQKLLAKLG
jgi:hypothetical protein